MATLVADSHDEAPRMYAAVFGREPERTRHLVQRLTPPMGPASQDAHDALASSRLDFDGPGAVAPAATDPALTWAPTPRDVLPPWPSREQRD